MDAAPPRHVVAFQHRPVAVGGRLKDRHAGDQLHGQGADGGRMHRQVEHRLGAAHIGRLQLAVGGHLAELGTVVQDAP